jgi:uncharacterized membrane protein
MTDRPTEPPILWHPPLVAAGAALLIAAFVTDLLYWRSTLFQWNNFSAWLLTGGLVLAGVAALALLVDVLRRRERGIGRLRFAGFAAAALLALLNAFVHSRDAWTAVVPHGLALSAVVAAILLLLGVRGWSLHAERRARPDRSREPRR